MKRLICLYPKAWRQRYGDEFAALLEELEPDWRMSADVLKGAFLMRMWSRNFTILAVSGVLGALAALGASFAIPKKYVSKAVVKVTPAEATGRIRPMSEVIMSRAGLLAIINNLSLYQTERSRMPLEDVVEVMRRNIRIKPSGAAFAVQFSYGDALSAQRVTGVLVSRYIEENLREAQAASPLTLELIDAPSLPVKPAAPRLSRIIVMGSLAGLALGAAATVIRRMSSRAPRAI